MTNPKTAYLAEVKRTFYERKSDHYRAHAERPMIEEVYSAMRDKHPIPIELSKKALLVGNARTVSVVDEFAAKFGPLSHPAPGDYLIGVKQCVDARSALFNLPILLQYPVIHERTAGSVVRHGGAFKVLSPFGRGYVSTHKSCGGEKVAHDFHAKGERANDPQIDNIIDSITHGVATITDPDVRSRWNARIQANNAMAILDSMDLGNDVHPLYENWSGWKDGKFDLEWLSTTQAVPDDIYKELKAVNEMTWRYSLANGITPDVQYAHAIIHYDPYRLGRVSGPRQIFDSSPNEIYCVTEDFRKATNGKPLSLSAVGSVRYAGFLDGGHVSGVGKADGNRHIVILDTDVQVLRAVREKLLQSSPEIAELSGNGASISLAFYDRDTARVQFIE